MLLICKLSDFKLAAFINTTMRVINDNSSEVDVRRRFFVIDQEGDANRELILIPERDVENELVDCNYEIFVPFTIFNEEEGFLAVDGKKYPWDDDLEEQFADTIYYIKQLGYLTKVQDEKIRFELVWLLPFEYDGYIYRDGFYDFRKVGKAMVRYIKMFMKPRKPLLVLTPGGRKD